MVRFSLRFLVTVTWQLRMAQSGCVPSDFKSPSAGSPRSSCQAAYPNNQCWTHNSCTNALDACISNNSPCQQAPGCRCTFEPRFCASNSGCGIVKCQASGTRALLGDNKDDAHRALRSDASCYSIFDRDDCIDTSGCRWSTSSASFRFDTNALSKGGKVGVAIAVLLVVGVLVGIAVVCCRKNQRVSVNDSTDVTSTPKVIAAND